MDHTTTLGSMIGFSWAKSREILFPFNFKRWLKILIIVWLAGAGIQGFSANFKVPALPARPSSSPQRFTTPQLPPMGPLQTMKMPQMALPQIPKFAGTPGPSVGQVQVLPKHKVTPSSISQETGRPLKLKLKKARAKGGTGLVIFGLIVAGTALGAIAVALALFFLWLSSRFSFVLLDTIVTRESAIKEPFKRYKESGNSYFKWSLAFLGISIGAFLIVGLIGGGLWMITKGNIALSVMSVFFAGLLALIIICASIVIGTAMRDFVLPLMYHEKIPAMQAMNKFLRVGRAGVGKIFPYFLVIFGLWIVAMIVQGVVSVLALIGGLIAGGILILPGIVIAKAVPLLALPLVILGSFVALALVLAVLVVIGMVMLPVVIFFRVFALAYLTRLYPECDLLGFIGVKS